MGSEMVHYALDRGVSRFTARAFASGMLSAFGHSPTLAIRRGGFLSPGGNLILAPRWEQTSNSPALYKLPKAE